MLTVVAETVSSSNSFHRLTTRSEKKYFLKSRRLLCFIRFNEWPLVLLSVDDSAIRGFRALLSMSEDVLDKASDQGRRRSSWMQAIAGNCTLVGLCLLERESGRPLVFLTDPPWSALHLVGISPSIIKLDDLLLAGMPRRSARVVVIRLLEDFLSLN